MRSHKPTVAILAAAALLALGTAGAASARTPHHKRRSTTPGQGCRVSLNVAPRLLTSGETVLAYGQQTCRSAPEAGQTVTLYERAAGSPGYSVAATTTTDSRGFYQVTTGPQTTNALFYAAIGSARSLNRRLKVAAQVTLVGPPETKQLFSGIRTGRRNAVTFTGTVSPSDAGALIVLQRENSIKGNEWQPIGRTIVNSAGGFALTHRFVFPGASNIRVMVRYSHRNIASPSNVLSYQISQAQNPSLTILSATDPVPYGGSTVISGSVPGVPGTAVTLIGRPAHGRFTTIATAMTDAQGDYVFPAQSPLRSMFYRVTGAGRRSAVLYEGVKYVLTAALASSTVTSGQPVSFSGTVTPLRAGHTIYLERRNISGAGFHVVSVGTVNADGSYSISRVLFAPGTEVLRVKIPGDPENGGAAGIPYTITVNPLPSASKLPPERNGNSALPPEGRL